MNRGLTEHARVLWGKSLNSKGEWLPLWRHSVDTSEVAAWLFDHYVPQNVIEIIADEFAGSEEDARLAIEFLAMCHDIGKATPAHEIQDTELSRRIAAQGLSMPSRPSALPSRELAHHTITGYHIVKRWLMDQGWEETVANTWVTVVAAHHGRPPEHVELRRCTPESHPYLYGTGPWVDTQRELLTWQAQQAGVTDRIEGSDRWARHKLSERAQILITAIVIMADRIASNEQYFPKFADGVPPGADAPQRTETAMRKLNLPSPWRASLPPTDIEHLYRTRFDLADDASIYPIQVASVEVAREMREPGLLIIEAPMGDGKTYAGLAVAEEFAARFRAGGLYYALPSQATADAKFRPIVRWLDRMGADEQRIGGSIMLSHGRRRLNPLFQELVEAGRLAEAETCPDQPSADTGHAVSVHPWTLGRNEDHFAHFTVATIDQLLFAGLTSWDLMLRHLSLAGKVVLIDEIHSYDPFMTSFLCTVLAWLGSYRVPVIALSATLPTHQRRRLLGAYLRGRASAGRGAELPDDGASNDDVVADGMADDASHNDAHSDTDSDGTDDDQAADPRLTWTDGTRVRRCVTAPSNRRASVHIEALEVNERGDDTESLVRILKDALSGGGNALVVRNTVRRALATASRLEREFPGEITVAHAQFMAADRARIDADLEDRVGSPGFWKRERTDDGPPPRQIVVATQVCEQSLDLDFDLLVTDLAPIDVLLQRIGRLHRFLQGDGQSDRPAKLRTPRAYIGGTDFTRDPPPLEPGAARYVYHAHTLLRAAAVLLPRLGSTIELPHDVAPLVEHAYGPHRPGPASWRSAMDAAEEDWRKETDCRRRDAEPFQVDRPGPAGGSILGWASPTIGRAQDSGTRSLVRDGDPSVEALLVQSTADGGWCIPPWLDDRFGGEHGGAEIPQDRAPSGDFMTAMDACVVRLPHVLSSPDVERALRQRIPTAWKRTRRVAGTPILVVDQHGNCHVQGRSLRYTPKRGLEVLRRGNR